MTMRPITSLRALALALGSMAILPGALAQDINYVNGTSLDGTTNAQLAPDRTPTLYTGDFGDCLGGESLLNVTQFDAALYWDNSTILMHLNGMTNIRDEDIMLHLSINAYGESRLSKVIDPCQSGMTSLCPMRASQPIGAFVAFPVTLDQVSNIPKIAFDMPDLEGFVQLQIFANSSKTEIACFQAVLQNGKTFSQPAAFGSVLAVFTIIAIFASFATAAYGVSIPHMRTHYAHSLSVLVIFETFQSIFFTGILSLEWPSILPAWWSNFAWASGLIYSSQVVNSVNSFVGISGNASQVGGAGSTVLNNNGGLTQQIYGRSALAETLAGALSKRLQETDLSGVSLAIRQSNNGAAPAYNDAWNGAPVSPGMPLPGGWQGFAGALTPLSIPAEDAFTISLIFTIVALALVSFCVTALKASLEGLVTLKWIQEDRLEFYRNHWTEYLTIAVLRTFFIALFSMTTLALYQFATGSGASAVAIAAIIFVAFLAGIGFLVWYALYARFQHGKFALSSDRILMRPARLFNKIPIMAPVRLSQSKEAELGLKPKGSLPFIRLHFIDNDPLRLGTHQDEFYIKRHGWLSARYRLSRWWFFSCWAAYQLLRACFLGGAAGSPLAQVFGLFILEILAFVIVWALNPYEGQRNTALAVWLLGLAKVITTGLSVAFLPDFNLNRISTVAIAILIIIVQACLTAAVVVLIILGCVSTWMSLYRNREYFVTDRLDDLRIRYYEHIAERAKDERDNEYPSSQQRRSKPKSTFMVNSVVSADNHPSFSDYIAPVEAPPAPGMHPSSSRHHKSSGHHSFSVSNVRRLSKIEDEEDYCEPTADEEASAPARYPPAAVANRPSNASLRCSNINHGRTASMTSQLSTASSSRAPRAARSHRVAWSSYDVTVDLAGRHERRPSSASGVAVPAPLSLPSSSLPNEEKPLPPTGTSSSTQSSSPVASSSDAAEDGSNSPENVDLSSMSATATATAASPVDSDNGSKSASPKTATPANTSATQAPTADPSSVGQETAMTTNQGHTRTEEAAPAMAGPGAAVPDPPSPTSSTESKAIPRKRVGSGSASSSRRPSINYLDQ